MTSEKVIGWRNRKPVVQTTAGSATDHRIIGLPSALSRLEPRKNRNFIITPPQDDTEKDGRFALRRGSI